MTDAFEDVTEHDSTPTIQAYIEANFGVEALDILKELLPILAGLV